MNKHFVHNNSSTRPFDKPAVEYGGSALHLFLSGRDMGVVSDTAIRLINDHKAAIARYCAAVDATDVLGLVETDRQVAERDDAFRLETVCAIACAYHSVSNEDNADGLAIGRHMLEAAPESDILETLLALPIFLIETLAREHLPHLQGRKSA